MSELGATWFWFLFSFLIVWGVENRLQARRCRSEGRVIKGEEGNEEDFNLVKGDGGTSGQLEQRAAAAACDPNMQV